MWVAWGNCLDLLFVLQTENLTSLFYGDSFCCLLQMCRFYDATNTLMLVQNANGHHWYAPTTGRQPVQTQIGRLKRLTTFNFKLLTLESCVKNDEKRRCYIQNDGNDYYKEFVLRADSLRSDETLPFCVNLIFSTLK